VCFGPKNHLTAKAAGITPPLTNPKYLLPSGETVAGGQN